MRFYLSHSIRGKYGDKATNSQIQENCEKAHQIAEQIRAELPSVELYVPGEVDEFVQIAYKKGYLTETQILEIDCIIISKCDGVLLYNPDNFISRGCQVEIDYACEHNIPVWGFSRVDVVVGMLVAFIMRA